MRTAYIGSVKDVHAEGMGHYSAHWNSNVIPYYVWMLQCLRPVSCVPNFAIFFGLSIRGCPSGFSNVYALLMECQIKNKNRHNLNW